MLVGGFFFFSVQFTQCTKPICILSNDIFETRTLLAHLAGVPCNYRCDFGGKQLFDPQKEHCGEPGATPTPGNAAEVGSPFPNYGLEQHHALPT